MFQKYYSENTNTKFIKELLRTTYIPTVPIWKPGLQAVKGLTYITKDYIVKCKEDVIPLITSPRYEYELLTELSSLNKKVWYNGRYVNIEDILKLRSLDDSVFDITNEEITVKQYLYKYKYYIKAIKNGRSVYFIVPDDYNCIYKSIDDISYNLIEYGNWTSTNSDKEYDGWYAFYPDKNYRLYYLTRYYNTNNGVNVNSIFDKTVNNEPYFEIVQPYVKGKYYRGITSNFESESSLYDYKTHYYLGEYLRYIRDLDGINLMSYYNCWDGRYTDRLNILKKDNKYTLEKLNDNLYNGYKTLIVPIKPNMDYTIYIDSSIPYEMCSVYYDGVNILTPKTDSFYEIYNYKSISYSSFNQPFTYRVDKGSTNESDIVNTNYKILQNQLVLLIKLPEINTSSVLVLEGNYINNKKLLLNTENLTDYKIGRKLDNSNSTILDKYFSSIPKLTKIVDGNNYAFDDILIEYLSLNVISSNDMITDNIKRIQEYISSSKCAIMNGVRYTKNYIPGIWNLDMRIFIYNMLIKGNFKKIEDINGFIDKYTEKVINRGK